MSLFLYIIDVVSALFTTEFFITVSGIIVFIAICNIIKIIMKGV